MAWSYVDPQLLGKLSSLTLKGRHSVEGFLSGVHKSTFKGFNVEFAEHREYSPGDEIRHVDWKVYGKSDRYYIKEYEEETNRRCFLVLDGSASMSYRGEKATWSKFAYACFVATSMAHILLHQGDSVGLTLCSKTLKRSLPVRAGRDQLGTIAGALEEVEPRGETTLGETLSELAGSLKSRSLVLVLSDLLEEGDGIIQAFKRFEFLKHEVMVFHVLDRDELTLPFRDTVRFEGLEEDLRVITDPEAIRREYVELISTFCEHYRRACAQAGMDYTLLDTSVPLDQSLIRFFSTRG
ncbi:MAG: DUF58 domain-containing protein [Candidatus Tectomicrobia bacterium]|uniref:DUF58 domain-containing protein n=1 Tax=Tectimicrobiota bacterium TaxID=2528274 RepID=A0A932GP54_UNCTE|nr:DUF58 domain-containing protein [Candidatus Tectomicrobia bacterium]